MRWLKPGILLLLLLYLIVVVRTAWMSDDAYITLRTVDNFVHGYGLRWNIADRVQSYTHPAWMFLFSAVYAITHEGYFTPLFLSIAISGLAVGLFVWKITRAVWMALFGLLALISSRAFIDYSTSGLENPLSHLLIVAFAWVYLDPVNNTQDNGKWPLAHIGQLSWLAGFAGLTRLDLLVLFLPALVYAAWQGRSLKAWLVAGVGLMPVMAWMTFSTFYYGFPLPNTAYAKLINQVPVDELVAQGIAYLLQSLLRDPLTLTLVVVSLIVIVRQTTQTRQFNHTWIGLGILLYLIYVIRIGGDFMSGRMFTPIFIAALTILAQLPLPVKRTLPWMPPHPPSPFNSGWGYAYLGLVLVNVLLPHASLWSGSNYRVNEPAYRSVNDDDGIADERGFYYRGTGLLRATWGGENPSFEWAVQGRALRERPAQVLPVQAVGMIGFFGGPRVHIIDLYALGDPLLARLPPNYVSRWRIGHFERSLPCGYQETLASGQNRIQNTHLAVYYEKIRLVTRGPLFERQRLLEIWNLNTRKYLIEQNWSDSCSSDVK